MDGFKEFQGKSLDEAIKEACAYFDASRERLEIDIIQDSKSGIFGLVGARKAKVKARRVQLRTAVEDILGRKKDEGSAAENGAPERGRRAPSGQSGPSGQGQGQGGKGGAQQSRGRGREADAQARKPAPAAQQPKPAPVAQQSRPAPMPAVFSGAEAGAEAAGASAPMGVSLAAAAPAPAPRPANPRGEKSAEAENGQNRRRNGRSRQRGAEAEHSASRAASPSTPPPSGPSAREYAHAEDSLADDVGEGLQHIPFEELDADRLCALSQEVVSRLVEPIVGKLPMQVALEGGRVNVCMDCGEDSGLLIGREGQTLASLQYLASRMVSRGMNAAVRVQLDAGEYRSRQDEKLREIALSLAEKVRATGKSHSTRPLSSYHRRIVHMVLQDEPDVQTRSSGDGPLKRVVVQRRRG